MREISELALNELESRISLIIRQNTDQKTKIKNINTELEELKEKIENQNREITELKIEKEKLQLALNLTRSNEDAKEATNKLNKIVREIDSCIALLNK